MVFITKCLHFAKAKKPLRQYLKGSLLDSLRLYVRGGSGGNGYPKFGGIGGKGGSIWVVGKENLTLEKVLGKYPTKRLIGMNGRHSTHNFILGTPGDDIKIDVPTGITVYTDENRRLGELNVDGEELEIAKGGTGGHPKNGYLGVQGQTWSIRLDLKLIADVGFVGFPNAGKSTLLKAISHAKPKIASYPFTTIKPNVGILMYKDLRQISLADLPGLIEGAYMNKGMGHRFLKHVERTKLLLFVVDINGFQLSPHHTYRNCLENIILLNKELELYDDSLLKKPAMLVINKMDTEGANEKYETIKERLKNLKEFSKSYADEFHSENFVKFDEILAISAQHNAHDVQLVKDKIRTVLDAHYTEECDSADTNQRIKESVRELGPKLI